MLWEHDNQYLDSQGVLQNSNSFSTGRACGGAKFIYPWYTDARVTIAPYVGSYVDCYFNNSGGQPLLLPTQFIQGFAGRVTGGVAYMPADDARQHARVGRAWTHGALLESKMPAPGTSRR